MPTRPSLRVVHLVCTDAFAGTERSAVLSARGLASLGHSVGVIGGHPERMPELLGPDVAWQPGATVPAAMASLARSGRADIVHAHLTAAETAAVLTRPFHRGTVVTTRHFAQRRGSSLAGRSMAVVINRSRHTEVAISKFVADHLELPSRIVHHGAESAPATVPDGKVVVVVQRLESEKRTGLALDIWERSGLGAAGWELHFAGSGAEQAALETDVRRRALQGVRFLGQVADVDGVRRSAAVQLATAPGEPFGLSVLEAMAIGLPVVAVDGGAHRELLGDEDAALFAPGDAEAGACALRHWCGDPAARHEYGSRLQARQRRLFSLDAHAQALEAVYLLAVGERRRSPSHA